MLGLRPVTFQKRRSNRLRDWPHDWYLAHNFRLRSAEHDYSLITGARALEPLLGPCGPGSSLADAVRRRGAVRLRRFFDAVRQAGEPVLAEFTLEEHAAEAADVTIL